MKQGRTQFASLLCVVELKRFERELEKHRGCVRGNRKPGSDVGVLQATYCGKLAGLASGKMSLHLRDVASMP